MADHQADDPPERAQPLQHWPVVAGLRAAEVRVDSARVAADQFRKCLEDGKTFLSVCKLRDVDGNLIFAGSSKAIVPHRNSTAI